MNQTYTVAYFHANQPCVFISETGVEGTQLKSAHRPVSLMSLQARKTVDQAERRGLCYQRFRADITLDCTEMPPKGMQLRCGDLILTILPQGKTCFPECVLIEGDLDCPLRDGVRFASVAHPGQLCQGDLLRGLGGDGDTA